MKFLFGFLLIGIFFSSCKTSPGSNRDNLAGKKDKLYKFELQPRSGTPYRFQVNHDTSVEFEVQDEEYENRNQSESVVSYELLADSSAELVFRIRYEKVKLLVKNGETETSSNSENSFVSGNPMDQLLKALTETPLLAYISRSGNVKRIEGLDLVSKRMLESTTGLDPHLVEVTRAQLDKLVGQGVVQSNLDQVFKVFPDSTVRLNDNWHVTTVEPGDIPVRNVATLTLDEISDEFAIIHSEGKLSVSNIGKGMLGMSNSMSKLEGDQTASYQVERKTGMLNSASSTNEIKGTVQVITEEVPITIRSKATIVRVK